MLNIKKLRPETCNICGGEVEYIQNKLIYGRPYGSGYCYHCTKCGAYVGTHLVRPKEAFGILSNAEMRAMRRKCHDIFDRLWRTPAERKKCYKWLAKELQIKVENCHFGYFDLDQLKKAYEILRLERKKRRNGS